jgi:hypothetical protein
MSNLVVVKKYRVMRDNKEMKDPSTIRERVIVPKDWYNQEIATIKSDPNYLGRVEYIEDYNGTKKDAVKKIIVVKEEVEEKPKEPTWNQAALEIKNAKTIEEAREIFAKYPQFKDSKAVVKAFNLTIETLAENED